MSVGEAFDYARAKVKEAYDKEGHILTEHAALEDSGQGKLAATLYLAPDKAKAVIAQTADPAMRARLEEQRDPQTHIEALRLKKDGMDPADTTSRLKSC